jgi:hypothetical protein
MAINDQDIQHLMAFFYGHEFDNGAGVNGIFMALIHGIKW